MTDKRKSVQSRKPSDPAARTKQAVFEDNASPALERAILQSNKAFRNVKPLERTIGLTTMLTTSVTDMPDGKDKADLLYELTNHFGELLKQQAARARRAMDQEDHVGWPSTTA